MTDAPATPPPLPLPLLPPSRRHDGWSVDRQNAFLTHLARFGGVAAAARAVGMSAKSACRLRDRSPLVAGAQTAAHDEGVLRSFDQAMDRAQNGDLVPVHGEGRIVGVRRRQDTGVRTVGCSTPPATRSRPATERRRARGVANGPDSMRFPVTFGTIRGHRRA